MSVCLHSRLFTLKSNSSLIDSFVFYHSRWLFSFFGLAAEVAEVYFLPFCLFVYDFSGSSLLVSGFLWLWRVGEPLRCSVRASLRGGLSCCHRQAPLWWYTGLVAPRHVGSSWIRDPTCVPFIGRQILNHRVTREVLHFCLSFSPDLRKRAFTFSHHAY